MKATVMEVESSHVPMLSKPKDEQIRLHRRDRVSLPIHFADDESPSACTLGLSMILPLGNLQKSGRPASGRLDPLSGNRGARPVPTRRGRRLAAHDDGRAKSPMTAPRVTGEAAPGSPPNGS